MDDHCPFLRAYYAFEKHWFLICFINDIFLIPKWHKERKTNRATWRPKHAPQTRAPAHWQTKNTNTQTHEHTLTQAQTCTKQTNTQTDPKKYPDTTLYKCIYLGITLLQYLQLFVSLGLGFFFCLNFLLQI